MAITQTEQKSALNIVMGAMTFGEPGREMARVHELKDVEAILDVFRSHGHTEIDTARTYTGGTSEKYLGQLDWQAKGLKMETKLATRLPDPEDPSQPISHSPEGLRKHLLDSLKALKTDCLEMWYLHMPDRRYPYEQTMKVVNDLYKEGHFKRFGISNFAAWEVAQIVEICKANGYIQPTAYQGIYNAIHRAIEPELLPCLRKYGISFYAFNPLGGGFFTGRYVNADTKAEAGSRFDPDRIQGKWYRDRYWNEPYFQALDKIKAAADRHGLTMAEVALRWISHHGELKREYGDAVIIGASSLNHIEQNLVDLEKGPLPEDVVKDLDEAWKIVQSQATPYFIPFKGHFLS